MKKLVSLVTILCMALSLCIIPAAAVEPTISVGTIAEGEVYTEGANIVLTADVSKMSDVKNVDFYANGDKLPGTLAGGTGSLIWYAPAAGNYAVKAVATTVSGATEESAVVNIKVSKEVENLFKFNSPEDIKKWKVGYEGREDASDDNVSTAYTSYSPYSLYVKNISYTGNSAIVLKDLDVTITKDNSNVYIPIYSTSDETLKCNVAVTVNSIRLGRNATDLKKGWNLYRIGIGSSVYNTKLTKFEFTEYGYGLDSTITNTDAYKNAEIYIGGAFLMPESVTTLPALTAETSIPDRQEKVCNNLSKYRITFSDAITESSVADAVTVTNTKDDTTVDVTTNVGANYIDVLFAEGTLAYGKSYKIAVSDAVKSILGASFAGAEYTFSTAADQCTDALPIASVVYPKAGADVATSTKLAAKVIFNGNVSKVEFYKGTELLGEATNYTGNEYVLDNAALAEGANAIKAVATLKDNSTVQSAEITVNATPATEYAIHGIAEGERVLINDREYKTVSVIDAADVNTEKDTSKGGFISVPKATDVSKVTYLIDGVVKHIDTDASTAYSWNMPFEKINEVTKLTVQILDTFGNLTEKNINFTAIYGDVYSEQFSDFENGEVEANKATNITTGKLTITNEEVSDNQHELKVVSDEYGKYVRLAPLNIINVPTVTNAAATAKFARIEFDVRKTTGFRFSIELHKTFNGTIPATVLQAWNGAGVMNGGINTVYHITIEIDASTGDYITYINDTEFFRANASGLKDITSVMVVANAVGYANSGNEFYLDNVKMTSYTHRTGTLDVEKEGSTVKAINTNADAEGIKVITATYNGNQLADVVIDDVTVPTNGIFNKEYTVGTNDKLFVWKDFVTLKPLTE